MRDDRDTSFSGLPAIGAAAVAFAAGLALAHAMPATSVAAWLIAAAAAGGSAFVVAFRIAKPRAAWVLWVIALVLTAAAWGAWRATPGRGDLQRYLGASSRLLDVSGRVVDGPVIQTDPPKGLAKFVFNHTRTRWVIDVRTIHGRQEIPAHGRLLVHLNQVDTRWRIGDQVRCQGWAADLGEVMNPGERDTAATLRREDIVGRMWLRSRGNMQLETMGDPHDWRVLRARWQGAAQTALDSGLQSGSQGAAFMDALVLGKRGPEMEEIYPVFRDAGLAHALAISGLHVGLAALMVWLIVMIVTGKPRWAAGAALVTVIGYVAMVPWRVPIVRAGFMTGVYCVGLVWDRRVRSIAVLGWIALAWLVMRPGDLFDAGFQLSYGVVAGLLLWTGPVARWMSPEQWWTDERQTWWTAVRRWLIEYAAVAVVAWAVATPLAAYHFGMVNPLAALVGAVMLPMLAVTLWAGLLKVGIGLLGPALAGSPVIAGPVQALGDACVNTTAWIAQQPGAAMKIGQPGVLWTAAALAVAAALFSGWFARRWTALGACITLLGIALIFGSAKPQAAPGSLWCTALAVGDGSCFVIQSKGETWLFDCGSGQLRNVGQRVVVPALEAMGVKRIDTLVVSHGDFDHFSGTLELCDALPVGRIVTSAAVLREAEEQRNGATAALIDGLRERHQRIDVAAQGWTGQLGDAKVEAIWPPADAEFKTNNDGSLVMRFSVQTDAGVKRLMMNGDIQGLAMSMMQQRGVDVKADVTDLPHHGSFPPGVLDWLHRVHPQIVLQSTGPRKLNWDNWAPGTGRLDGITRLVTARQGAVTVRFGADGGITWQSRKNTETGGNSGEQDVSNADPEEDQPVDMRP